MESARGLTAKILKTNGSSPYFPFTTQSHCVENLINSYRPLLFYIIPEQDWLIGKAKLSSHQVPQTGLDAWIAASGAAFKCRRRYLNQTPHRTNMLEKHRHTAGLPSIDKDVKCKCEEPFKISTTSFTVKLLSFLWF